MAKYKVDITGINTNNLKVLKSDEMLQLFKDYQSGNYEAREKIISGNYKLILSILRRFNNQKFNMDDLFQIGCIGLIKAVDNFDLSHEVKFSTYAVPLILGEVKRYVRDNSPLRVSRSIKDLAYKIINYEESYYLINGFFPKPHEIATYLDVKEYEITNAMDSLKEPMSIYEPIYNDGGDTIYLLDQLADTKEQKDNKDNKILLAKALKKIKEREKRVLLSRYLIGKTQMEIATSLGISQAQVSRIEKTAIKNIKRLIK